MGRHAIMRRMASERSRGGRRFRAGLVAFLLAFLLATSSAVAFTHAAAHADGTLPAGITQASLLLNGSAIGNAAQYDGDPVVKAGDTLGLHVQYTSAAADSTVTFDMAGLSGITTSTPVQPTGNTAIASWVWTGTTLAITFKPADGWGGVNQGVFDLDFAVNSVTVSSVTTLTWKIGSFQGSQTAVVLKSGDTPANVTDSYNKQVSPSNLNSSVHISNDGVVTFTPPTSNTLTYTLTLDSAEARTDYPITDTLPAGLEYGASGGSLVYTANLTTWDAYGLNKSSSTYAPGDTDDPVTSAPVTTSDGAQSFTATVNVPAQSILKVTYAVTLTSDEIAALQTQLQASYDGGNKVAGTAVTAGPLKNTATFGIGGSDATKSASVTLSGSVPGVSGSQAFTKSADWTYRMVATNSDDSLVTPAPITYTITSNLSKWNGSGNNFTLAQNVYLTDTLPSQETVDPDDITVTGGVPGVKVDACPPGLPSSLSVGEWCLSGNTFTMNLGQDNKAATTTVTIPATLTTLADLSPRSGYVGQSILTNQAKFAYQTLAMGSAATYTASATSYPFAPTPGGYDDATVFTKKGPAEQQTTPGASAVVPYTLTLGAHASVDVRDSTITDILDRDVFPVTDDTLAGADPTTPGRVAVTGSYGGTTLTAADFTLSLDADQNLQIALSTSGQGKVSNNLDNQQYVVKLSLTSVVLTGKQTLTLQNSAILYGQTDIPFYKSETVGDATSYGDEAQVSKTLWDADNTTWASDVTDGWQSDNTALTSGSYVYQIAVTPHGQYGNGSNTFAAVSDKLPAGLTFQGFVTVDSLGAPDTSSPTTGPVTMGSSNLEAVYDSGTDTVSVRQKSGTLDGTAGAAIPVYFEVQIDQPATAGTTITNTISGSTASITIPLKTVAPVAPSVAQALCSGPGQDTGASILPATTTGITYTIHGDVLPGKTVTVTAAPEDQYTLTLPNDSGWSANGDGTATYTVHLNSVDCIVPATPVVPTVTQQVCTGPGKSSGPVVKLADTTGISYTYDEAQAKAGHDLTVTARAGTGYRLGASLGWTLRLDGTATYTVHLDKTDCVIAVTPVAPKATQRVCTGPGKTATVKTAVTTGIRYTVSTPARVGHTVTVTARPDTGYTLKAAKGWTLHKDGTATWTIRITRSFCGVGAAGIRGEGGMPGLGGVAVNTGGTIAPAGSTGLGFAAAGAALLAVLAGGMLLVVRRRRHRGNA